MKTGIKLTAVALLSGVLSGCGDLSELDRMLSDSAKREKYVLGQIDKIRAESGKQGEELDKMEAMIAENNRVIAENNRKMAEINKLLQK